MSPTTPQRNFLTAALLLCLLSAGGCAANYRKAPGFESDIKAIKTIAVLPPDVRVYQLTAGGIREEIDEWTATAKTNIQDSLKKHFNGKLGFELKFVTEDFLKANHKDLWKANSALYEAVATSALSHSYPGPNAFADKLKSFDYTLGADVKDLAQALGADGLLFVNGYDHEATAGRVAMVFLGALSGVTPTNPSLLSLGLVDGKTGTLEWFNIFAAQDGYNYRNSQHIDKLIESLTKDFLKKESH